MLVFIFRSAFKIVLKSTYASSIPNTNEFVKNDCSFAAQNISYWFQLFSKVNFFFVTVISKKKRDFFSSVIDDSTKTWRMLIFIWRILTLNVPWDVQSIYLVANARSPQYQIIWKNSIKMATKKMERVE